MPASLTPSGLLRATRCPAACALPSVRIPAGPGALRGRAVHDWIATALLDGDAGAVLDRAPDDARAIIAGLDTDALVAGLGALPGDPRLHVEHAMVYDVRSGRARTPPPGRHERDYGRLAPTEIAGRADVVIAPAVPGGCVVIIDWKTTQYVRDDSGDRAQLGAYAVMAASLYDADSAECVACVVTEKSALAWERWTLDADDLATAAADLQATVAAVDAARATVAAGRTPDVEEGPWCRWCSALRSCPATEGVCSWLDAEDMWAVWLAARKVEHLAALARDRVRTAVESGVQVRGDAGDGRAWELRIDGQGALRRYRAGGER